MAELDGERAVAERLDQAGQLVELVPAGRERRRELEQERAELPGELETALARRLVEETAPLADAGKLGSYLVQLTPAFSPRHSLEELDNLIEALKPHRVAVELRNRNWVSDKRREGTLRWFADRDVAFVEVDAPPDDHFSIMPSGLDAVTSDSLAYLRLHGRNSDGYLKGKSVAERFGWRYDDEELEEVAGRVAGLAEQAGEVHVAFNNNRGDDAPTAAQRFRALLGQAPAADEQLSL